MQLTTLPSWDLPDMAENHEPDFEDIPTSAILEMIQRCHPAIARCLIFMFLKTRATKKLHLY